MREKLSEKDERYRAPRPDLPTFPKYSTNGWFERFYHGVNLRIMSTSGQYSEWEHVSVSTKNRCPNWEEMCLVKNMFWGEEEVVVQFHPKKSKYVNNHEFCLHLWKRRDREFETPPEIFVGIKDAVFDSV